MHMFEFSASVFAQPWLAALRCEIKIWVWPKNEALTKLRS